MNMSVHHIYEYLSNLTPNENVIHILWFSILKHLMKCGPQFSGHSVYHQIMTTLIVLQSLPVAMALILATN